MFITKGHFLSPFVRVIRGGKPMDMLHSVDTDMLVAIRVVGFDKDNETPILDLVKVDEIQYLTARMPSHLQDLLPKDCKIIEELEDGNDSEEGSDPVG